MSSLTSVLPPSPLSPVFRRSRVNLELASKYSSSKHPVLKRPFFPDEHSESSAKRQKLLGDNFKFQYRRSIAIDIRFVPATTATFQDEQRLRVPGLVPGFESSHKAAKQQRPVHPEPVKPAPWAPTPNQAPLGFVNEGATKCYRNALLQCLLHIPEINGWLEQHRGCVRSRCVACRLRILSQFYWGKDKSNCNSVHTAVRNVHGLMELLGWTPGAERHRQQDSREYLNFIIEKLTAQLSKADADAFNSIFSVVKERSTTCSHCNDCYTTATPEPITIVPLNPQAPNLEHYIYQSLLTEISDRRCEKCRKLGGEQVTEFASRPAVLCLALQRGEMANQRGQFISKKCFTKVRYPTALSLSRFASSAATSKGPLDYELTSVIYHHGQSMNSGHYTAEVNRDGKWLTFDDRSVSTSSEKQALGSTNKNSTPYLLFYHLK